ncbi:translation initiation factor 2 [Actinoplanes sp. NPDC051861]|uniref:translation initiation factor 2 n=1 Tax=Actinoplanes sp. NPDC051861 TaxID=3155170 RepID=UPI00343093C3
MFHQHFLSAAGTDLGPLDSGERVLWQGRCAVAEYAFDEESSLPRWTLPEETDVVVTDRRVRYTYATDATLSSGEMFWLWPQHLRVQPGNRETGRTATITQIQLVCNGPAGSFPALVFAGGELATVGDADRLANVIRQAIARFRVENAAEIGVPTPQARMLSRLVIGPEFTNYQGGKGQTVTLLGSVPVPAPLAEPEPVDAPAAVSFTQPASFEQPVYEQPAYEQVSYEQPVYHEAPYEQAPTSGGRAYAERPGIAADAMRAEQAIRAEQDSRYAEPDLASRAASLAARVASLVSNSPDEGQTTNLSAFLSPPDNERR